MTETTARSSGPGLRSGPHRAYTIVLTLFLLDGLLQIALAGWGAFSDKRDSFEPHEVNASVLAALALLAIVLAAVAREGTRAIGACVVLLIVVSPVQMLLANLGDDAAFWGALHALVGLGTLGLAGFLHGRAIKGERV
jgi:uncharacterized protein DUF6220